MVKDLKRSIRNKYKRREVRLYYAIEQYLIYAEERLDQSVAGKARNKERIEKISQKCRELLDDLPEPIEYKIDSNRSIEGFLGENSTDEIIEAGRKWFDNLSAEELEEIRNHANREKI